MELKFRDLKADEIDVRVATVSEKGVSLLLYKDARVDQNILDETVGALNWQRKHSRENANCEIGIWDNEKSQWVWKEDTGTESYTEKEKGLASDSFKRAGFNWGIGRELYTAPFIWIFADKAKVTQDKTGKYTTKEKFYVSSIKISNKVIVGLTLVNSQRQVVFKYTYNDNPIDSTKIESMKNFIKTNKISEEAVISTLEDYGYENIEQIIVSDYKIVGIALKELVTPKEV